MASSIHVIGAGGIGGAVGYALAAAGLPVTIVEADITKVAAGKRGELRINGRSPVKATFISFDEWQPIPHGWVFLCTKCYDNAPVLERIRVPVRLVPVQNGFDPQLETFDHEFEGIASFVAHCRPGLVDVRITRPGDLHLGRKRAGPTPDADLLPLAGALAACRLFRVKVVPRIESYKYAKLMYNAAISPLAAAAGLDNGKLLSLPAARRVFFALIQENYRILSAAGIELGQVGPFQPATVAWILRRKWLARALAFCFEPSMRGTYCSMAGEIQKGRTELDNYNGHLLHLAEKTGTPAPINRAVYDVVVEMTRKREEPSFHRMNALWTLARSA